MRGISPENMLFLWNWRVNFIDIILLARQTTVINSGSRQSDNFIVIADSPLAECHHKSQLNTGTMGLLPDTQKCGLRKRRECREPFPGHRLQREPPVSDPGMHPGTCAAVMHVGDAHPRWRGKRSRHSRPKRNPYYISGKRPIVVRLLKTAFTTC